MAKQVKQDEEPEMIKLKELATEYGPGLGRVKTFTNAHAKAILAGQDAGGPVCWAIADEKTPETDEAEAPVTEADKQDA